MLLVMDLGSSNPVLCSNALCTSRRYTFHDICDCSLCRLQELSGVTQLQAVKDSYVPVIKFQVICLDAGSPALWKSYACTAASAFSAFLS